MSTIQDSVFEEEVRTAHLDSAHVGDIQGAWGTIRRGDTARRKTWFQRLLTLLVIMGPGLVVMIGDNDAGGVATYAQGSSSAMGGSKRVHWSKCCGISCSLR